MSVEKMKPARNIEELSADLLELLTLKGYGNGTLNNYRRTLACISLFMNKKGLAIYTEEVGKAFLSERIVNLQIGVHRQIQIKTLLRRLNELNDGLGYRLLKPSPGIMIPAQYEEMLDAYLFFCRNHGNKETTISEKRRFCSRFLFYLADMGCKELQQIDTKYICQACLRFSNKDAFAVIRSFLYFLFEADILDREYSAVVPKYRKPIILPTTYTTDEINRLEGSVDKSSKIGKRDLAIMFLATRLGLRSGDITALKFENIDFERNMIHLIQSKTEQPLSLPLLPDVGAALQDYICHARPRVESDYVFLREIAPFERITTSVIRFELTRYFKAAGIDVSGKKHGPHTLRATLASSMINENVPYEVVRKALGHIDPQAIKHYARIDIENLRRYAIDIPTPTGLFAKVLQGRESL